MAEWIYPTCQGLWYKSSVKIFLPAFALVCCDLLVCRLKCDLYHHRQRQTERRERSSDKTSFFKWHCVAALHSDWVSLYLSASLPSDSVTKWLPASSQCKAVRCPPCIGGFALLASYWSPNCSFVSSFIVLYWRVLKWLVLLNAHPVTFWKLCHATNIQHRNICQASVQLKGPFRHLIQSLRVLLYLSSSSWVCHAAKVKWINPSWPLAAERGKDRKGGIYGTGAINRRKGPYAELIYVCLHVFACLRMCVSAHISHAASHANVIFTMMLLFKVQSVHDFPFPRILLQPAQSYCLLSNFWTISQSVTVKLMYYYCTCT